MGRMSSLTPTSPAGSPGPTTHQPIAEVQVRAWRTTYAGVLPDDLIAALDPEEIADGLAAGPGHARPTPVSGCWSPSSGPR